MKLNDDFFGGDQAVQCPYCDSEDVMGMNVHMSKVEVLPIQGAYRCDIDSSGVQIKTTDAASRQRGASVYITFTCEAGHVWRTEFLFHKGSTLVRDRQHADRNPLEGETDIWRD